MSICYQINNWCALSQRRPFLLLSALLSCLWFVVQSRDPSIQYMYFCCLFLQFMLTQPNYVGQNSGVQFLTLLGYNLTAKSKSCSFHKLCATYSTMFPQTGVQACFVDIVILLVFQSIYFIYRYSLIFSESSLLPLISSQDYPPFIDCFLFLTIMNNSISSTCLTETYVHETMYLYDDISPMKEYVVSHMYKVTQY